MCEDFVALVFNGRGKVVGFLLSEGVIQMFVYFGLKLWKIGKIEGK